MAHAEAEIERGIMLGYTTHYEAISASECHSDQPPLRAGAFNSSYTVRATGSNSSRVTSPESA